MQWLYQYLQQYMVEIQEPDLRKQVRDAFFEQVIPEGIALFSATRHIREFRNAIEATLEDDWEFQFVVNYFLRDAQYINDLANSPYEQAKGALLSYFK